MTKIMCVYALGTGSSYGICDSTHFHSATFTVKLQNGRGVLTYSMCGKALAWFLFPPPGEFPLPVLSVEELPK